MADQTHVAKDDAELGRAVKLSQRRIRELRQEHPEDAPETRNVEEWAEFLTKIGTRAGRSENKTRLQEEKLKEEIALLKLKRSREEGATVLVADVREFLGQVSAKNAQLIRMKYDTELPTKLTGKDIVGIRQTISATTDEVFEIINRGLLEWNPGS